MGDVAQIARVGGHLAVDFVNTLGGLADDPDDEYLFDYGDLLTWSQGAGLVSPALAARLRRAARRRPADAVEAFGAALGLRSHLDDVLRSRLEGDEANPGALGAVRDAYVAALARAELVPDAGGYRWAWPDTRALDLLGWLVAHEAVDLLRGGDLDRLTRCGHCRWLFLDRSRNRSRRWCSMSTCGSVVKMRRYRAARR